MPLGSFDIAFNATNGWLLSHILLLMGCLVRVEDGTMDVRAGTQSFLGHFDLHQAAPW